MMMMVMMVMKNEGYRVVSDNDHISKRFCSNAVLPLSFTQVKTRMVRSIWRVNFPSHILPSKHDRKAFDPLPATQKATPTSSFCSSA